MILKRIAIIPSVIALAQAFTFTVTVGIDETNGHQGIGFDPSTIVPAAGDTIVFTYALPEYIKNPPSVQHSATQSTFDAPCTPKEGGFDTGVQNTGSVNDNTGTSFSLTVNNTDPLWFFSSVGSDCKDGMVLAVNPPTTGDQTAAAFKAKAMGSSGSQQTSASSGTSPSSATPSGSVSATQSSGGSTVSSSTAAQPTGSSASSSASSVSAWTAVLAGTAAMLVFGVGNAVVA
ncbi:hypothetical protein BDY19DRAFT_682362 [Irpex rosettiformis]|uniref:Uncharacterized protein n=1 Tax=Irpex rosettiformis TaxID=378272 RepID=A0ACB8UA28_9APHY|nr:hypothetical protein BDY19DRAFT_682362 [Irpex rosettiformis]